LDSSQHAEDKKEPRINTRTQFQSSPSLAFQGRARNSEQRFPYLIRKSTTSLEDLKQQILAMKDGDTSTTRARSPGRTRTNMSHQSPTRGSMRIAESPGGQNLSRKDFEHTSTRLQLEKLSKQLEKAGFSPLHPSLLFTTKDDIHVPGTLSDTQGLSLISTLSVLINEFENRGSTIQQLVQQNPQKSVHGAGETPKALSKLETESVIQELQSKIQHNEYVIDKLKFEASAAQQRQESQRIRNDRILEAIKQEYDIASPTTENVLSRIIAIYEEKLQNAHSAKVGSPVNPFEDLSEMSSPNAANANEIKLQVKLEQLNTELDQIKKERDMLQLRLINESKTIHRDPNDTKGLSTRELIQRDKKQWKIMNGDLIGMTEQEMKLLIQDICTRLGITDYQNVGSCIEKIEFAVKLIPQMEQFIREVNAIIFAYNLNISQSTGTQKTLKLSKSLEVVREWAESSQTNVEHKVEMINSALHSRYTRCIGCKVITWFNRPMSR
jgi:uncharacterized protein YecA (UPF0149 family)